MPNRSAVMIALGAVTCGCASHAAPQTKQEPIQKPGDLPAEVSAAKVTLSEYGPPPAHALIYEVHTDSVAANLGTGQLESGVTGNVSGTLYGKQVCDFKALSARGSKSSPNSESLDVLTLVGAVAIHCRKPEGNLQCDQLTVNTTSHVAKALGHVRFDTAQGIQGSMPEAWATQDLSRIASPEIFEEGVQK